MRIYLVQHGESKSKDLDPDRILTDKGVRDVQKVADLLRPLSLTLQAVWHSGKPRAKQTAEILYSALSAREGISQRDGLAPTDPVLSVRQAIETLQGDLMIVGHLPFLSGLAGLLLRGEETDEVVAFQFGGVLCLERNDERTWQVDWMVVPRILPE